MQVEKQAIIDAHTAIVAQLNTVLTGYLADLEARPEDFKGIQKNDAICWFLESL